MELTSFVDCLTSTSLNSKNHIKWIANIFASCQVQIIKQKSMNYLFEHFIKNFRLIIFSGEQMK